MINFSVDPIDKVEKILSTNEKRGLVTLQTAKELSGFFKMPEEDIKEKISRGNFFSLKVGVKTVIPRDSQEISTFLSTFDQHKKKDAYIITIANAKGGVLKTANTSNIGASLAFFGKKVLMTDGDVTQCSLTHHYSANESTDEADYLTNILLDVQDGNLKSDEEIAKRVKKAICNIDTSDKFTQGRLDILPSLLKLKDRSRYIETTSSKIKSLHKVINAIKSEYDFIIIDTPPSAVSPIIDLSYYASDFVLLSLKAEPETNETALEIIKPIIEINETYGRDCKLIGAIYGQFNNTNISKAVLKPVVNGLVENVSPQFMVETVSFAPTIAEVQLGGRGASIFHKPKSRVTSEYLDISMQLMLHSMTLGV